MAYNSDFQEQGQYDQEEFAMRMPVKSHLQRLDQLLQQQMDELDLAKKEKEQLRNNLIELSQITSDSFDDSNKYLNEEYRRLMQEFHEQNALQLEQHQFLKQQVDQINQDRIKLEQNTIVLENRIQDSEKNWDLFDYKQMKIKLAIIFNLLILLNASSISIAICKCEQLLSQTDCQHQNNNCLWISDKCVINPSQSDSGAQIITYCTSYTESECASIVGCAWINKACEQFLGCTAYFYSKYIECQQISRQCQTDGSHCIEISDCADYKTKSACSRNQKNVLCYWNEEKCEDFTECSQLPKTLSSDRECRDQLQKCTVGDQSGCVESAENCEDQKSVSQCKWNKLKTQQCIWQSDKCVSLSCSNAPVTYTTHSQCYEFMAGCTTQQNGGCTNITQCSNAKIEDACVINNLNGPCIWSDNSCYDQVCNKAPTTFKTNEQCKTIANNCITTLNGCVEQLSCSSANNQTGCIDMADGTKCFWNGSQCVIKGCSSNTSATSQAECEAFSSECIFNVSASIGCVDKFCENIIQQDQCTVDAFNNNCIWKSNCFVKQCVLHLKHFKLIQNARRT